MAALTHFPFGGGPAFGSIESATVASVDVTLTTATLTLTMNNFIIGVQDGDVDIVTQALTISMNNFIISSSVAEGLNTDWGIRTDLAILRNHSAQENKGIV